MREILLANQFKESELFFSWTKMGKHSIFHVAKVNQSHQFINMFFCRGKFFSDINKKQLNQPSHLLTSNYVLISTGKLLLLCFHIIDAP